jgi:alcohol dehydrogenase class IV
MSSYYNPVRIIKTDDWHRELNFRIKDLKISVPLLVTSPGNRKRLNLDSTFLPNSIFSEVSSNPNFMDCKNIIKFCQGSSFDGVVAIGGGSAMDLAKVVIAHLSLGKTSIYELIEYQDDYPNSIPSIFLPTTHGTASEVTMWGTIWNMEEKKYSISHPSLYPTIAILDGSLTLSLPIDISITTTMDALSHSFEAIWNKNSNPISTDYAITAICLILNNADELKRNPKNIDVRNNLLEAANTAGLAFSNTATAAAHSISYPLTIHYGIPHGIASSITLLPLLEINGRQIKVPLDKICDNLDLNYDKLKHLIKKIPNNVIPYSLKEWGITKNQIPKLASDSFTKGRMDNNIVDLNKEDVYSILESIY